MLPHLLGELCLTANDLRSSTPNHVSFHYRKVCSALDSAEAPVLSGGAVYNFFVVSSSHNRRTFSALFYLLLLFFLSCSTDNLKNVVDLHDSSEESCGDDSACRGSGDSESDCKD